MHHRLIFSWRAAAAFCFLSACGDADSGGEDAPDDPAPIAENTGALGEASYAGRLEDGETFIAIVTNRDRVRAYVCDGISGHWFDGSVIRLPAVLTTEAGATLYLSAADGALVGAFTPADGMPMRFDAPETEESSLFRAETRVGQQEIVGGWIVLPDGEQRGLFGRGDTSVRSAIDRNQVVVAEGNPPGRVQPARFVPAALAQRVANVPLDFNLVSFGDSYGAGEGAPEEPGEHGIDGVAGPGESRETWDLDATSAVPDYTVRDADDTPEPRPSHARIAEACHRSGANGFFLATDALADEWPAVTFDAESFACSGSKTEVLYSTRYRGPGGPDELDGWELLPQLDQLDASLEARPRDVDAIYMSIGGNDLHFTDVMITCLIALNCDQNPIRAGILGAVNAGAVEAQAGFDAINDGILARGLVADANVYISRNPSPLFRGGNGSTDPDDAELCQTISLTGWPEIAGALETIVMTSGEIRFANLELVGRMTVEISAAARRLGWNQITSHIGPFKLHGWCSDTPWIGTLRSGLETQGADIFGRNIDIFGLSFDVVVPVSGGLAHPNADGYADGYAPAIHEALRRQVVGRIRPTRPGRLRVVSQVAGGAIKVRWDDLSNSETEFELTITKLGGAANSQPSDTVIHQGQLTEYTIEARGEATYSVQVAGCHSGSGSNRTCSTPSALVRMTNFKPKRVPTGLRAQGALCREGCSNPLRMFWDPLVDPEFAHLYYEVDYDQQRIATQETFIEVGPAQRFRVRSCNFVGCGPFSLFETGPQETQVPPSAAEAAIGDLCDSLRDVGSPGGTPDPAGLCRR